MKTLKRLLESGDNAAILEYVRSNNFADIVSGYEALASQSRGLKKDYIKLYQESVVRSEELAGLREQIGAMQAKLGNEAVGADKTPFIVPQSAR